LKRWPDDGIKPWRNETVSKVDNRPGRWSRGKNLESFAPAGRQAWSTAPADSSYE
jgi:hypothetical protein